MYHKTTLDNGLRLIVSPMPHALSVSMAIFVGTGSRYESERQAGISHFIEHLLFKGTPKRSTSREISGAIEGMGGTLNGGTDKELTVYWCKVAQNHFHLALDVLTDMLLNSKFDPAEIEKERQVVIEEINMSKDSPSQQVNMLIDSTLWPRHPLGRDTAGSKRSVAALTREDMLKYMERQYTPRNTVVSIAGNVDPTEVTAAVAETLGGWGATKPHKGYRAYNPGADSRRVVIQSKDTEQTHLCLALPGLSLRHPQRFALDLMNVILGEGMSSRLFTEVRDRLGLAYSIHSYAEHFLDSGALIVYAGTEAGQLERMIKAILGELARIKDISEEELAEAKESAKGRLLLRLENSRGVASWLGGQEILNGRVRDIDQMTAVIDAVTTDDVKHLSRGIIDGDRLHLAVVGPVSRKMPLEPLLKI